MRLFKIWNIYAYFYDSILCLLAYKKLINQTFNVLKKFCHNPTVLDAGCGTGNFAKKIVDSNYKMNYIGIDGSEEMLSRAVQKTRGLDRFHFFRSNLNNGLNLKSSSVDAIVSLNVLYSIISPQNLIKEFHRVLRFGGIVILANPHNDARVRQVLVESFFLLKKLSFREILFYLFQNFFSLIKLFIILPINVIIKKRASQKTFHFFDKNELTKIFEDSGFKVLYSGKTYGQSDLFFVATKIISEIDIEGKHLSMELIHRKKDLDIAKKIRYEVYCNCINSLNSGDYPSGKEEDKYDQYSIHFLLIQDKKPIGTIRLIRETPDGFLMEESFNIAKCNLDRKKMLEPSRIAILPSKQRRYYSKYLDDVAELWSKENGYLFWCIAINVKLYECRLRRRWNMNKIGNLADYHNTEVYPVIRFLN